MEFFDSKGFKWRQNANGSWSRWTGSNWVAPDAQYAAPPTPGMVGTNTNEYSDNQGFRWAVDANGQHWKWNGSAWLASDPSPDYTPTAKPGTPTPTTPQPATIDIPGASGPDTGPTLPGGNTIDIPSASQPNTGPTLPGGNTVDLPAASNPENNPAIPPPSYDPPAGGPTYTPGIVFGQGQPPGVGPGGPDTYQRQWFDIGGNTPEQQATGQIYYNDPANWQLAWDKVVNQFGGMPGGDFNKWLSNFSTSARGDFQNTVPYVQGAKLNVSDFLDQYAPQIKGVYDLMPGVSKGRGGALPLAGRANY